MSDDDSDKDLFGSDSGGESDDTDELIATSKSSSTKKKSSSSSTPKRGGRLQKKSDKNNNNNNNNNDDDNDIGNNNNDDDDDDDDDSKGLFDSDEEDESPATKKKPASASTSTAPTKTLSKRERMEALKAKKLAAAATEESTKRRSSSSSSGKKDKSGNDKSKKSKNPSSDGNTDKGYDSSASFNSAEYVRTKEDDDFIDTQGEDEEMVREYYAEQHFEDERELEEMEVEVKKKGRSTGGGGSSKKRGPDQLSAADKKDKDNPISIVVERMKKKKKVTKRFEELKEHAMELIERMEHAAKEDDKSLKAKKPGLKKLQMLSEVLDTMIKREMMRPLLEADFLIVAKKWIEPLPNGSLGNVTLRQQMIDGIAKMNGDFGIDNDDLKKSEFGKLVMTLYMHKKETPVMKRKLKALIEQWSRRIFRKSGDMKQLGSSQAQRRSEAGLVGIAKAQASMMEASGSGISEARKRKEKSASGKDSNDLATILSDGVKQARDLGRNRVRVPQSKGFQFTVRPENKSGDVADKKTRVFSVQDQRESLHKRMLDKNKRTAKNSRSANISIEGRPAK